MNNHDARTGREHLRAKRWEPQEMAPEAPSLPAGTPGCAPPPPPHAFRCVTDFAPDMRRVIFEVRPEWVQLDCLAEALSYKKRGGARKNADGGAATLLLDAEKSKMYRARYIVMSLQVDTYMGAPVPPEPRRAPLDEEEHCEDVVIYPELSSESGAGGTTDTDVDMDTDNPVETTNGTPGDGTEEDEVGRDETNKAHESPQPDDGQAGPKRETTEAGAEDEVSQPAAGRGGGSAVTDTVVVGDDTISHKIVARPVRRYPDERFELHLKQSTEAHGAYTDLSLANGAALRVLLAKGKPNHRGLEENLLYFNMMRPYFEKHFEEHRLGQGAYPADLEWSPPAEGQRWAFRVLRVWVHYAELEGPVDLGGLIVEPERAEVEQQQQQQQQKREAEQQYSAEDLLGMDLEEFLGSDKEDGAMDVEETKRDEAEQPAKSDGEEAGGGGGGGGGDELNEEDMMEGVVQQEEQEEEEVSEEE
ncbi:hypothetical protein VTK73DRAFT_4453 [Phialemonium thermophilum]|uniref:Uncharacterized protein n=1 Tax=Phialemonium thermophilum TaxID=223376 RepID=A0ABR3V8F7_9PEZI